MKKQIKALKIIEKKPVKLDASKALNQFAILVMPPDEMFPNVRVYAKLEHGDKYIELSPIQGIFSESKAVMAAQIGELIIENSIELKEWCN
jgi:hypothetical protein